MIVAVFIYFADFSFGFTGDAVAYKDRQWLKSWNVYEGWDHEDVQVEEETE